MPAAAPPPPATHPASHRLHNAAGLRVELLAHGALRRIDCGDVMVNLFPGNPLEGGPANLWLRRLGGQGIDAVPLLGPASPLRAECAAGAYRASGRWQGLQLTLELRLADEEAAWFWHLHLQDVAGRAHTLDLVSVQDVGLAPYAAARLNEHYVSHYVDFTPLTHDRHGAMLAARQNLPVAGRHPWLLMGSLRRGARRATDALQWLGLAVRAGGLPQGLVQGLPGPRLQHEHALAAIQDEPFTLAPGGHADAGCYGRVLADHPVATGAADLALADRTLALPQARPPQAAAGPGGAAGEVDAGGAADAGREGPGASLFARAPLLAAMDLAPEDVDTLFGAARRHEETDGGTLLSFFHGAAGDAAHVVLRAKELRVQRPHGHILRCGNALVPDETALTSTVWMAGVFHSMVTQGHVSINRFLSTVRGYLGQFRSHGQRLFVQLGGQWQQLGVPSAFEIRPQACRWLYRHADGLLEVRSATARARELTLEVRALHGPLPPLLLSHHVALGGDDGAEAAALPLQRRDGGGVFVGLPPGSELASRFGAGGFAIEPEPGTVFEAIGGDGLLYADGRARGEPVVCLRIAAGGPCALRLVGELLPAAAALPADAAPLPAWQIPAASALAGPARQLADILPWYHHNALVHYLAPRGLEQYSGGGWGTRDVCQGPLEMLLALDRPQPVRDLLRRVFSAQDAGGDWPQWFMFFERDRHIRAGDSHGDIVYWPLLALARYLLASGDAALLDEDLPFHAAPGSPAQTASLWQHVQRALAVIDARRIPGTHLAAYGHGDWNDSLQPADPALRERLCSAWTVTLHHQVLHTLARALRGTPREAEAAALHGEAAAVLQDFQRLLVAGGVVTGYALFPPDAPVQRLLHPEDTRTGLRYSLLPMMHAILDDMLSPEQAAEQLRLVQTHLSGPDGARLFDRPLPYRGGPMTLFQRAESSAFFGREIGVMYMHAHLRWAETLAHLGLAEKFFDALALAHPIALRQRVASASLRQANCYYSSSDAAFADRYEAQEHYGRIASGEVALDGGWRIYSSGPGIAIAVVVGRLLGIRREAARLVVDPVMPQALDGLRARLSVAGRELELVYRVGPRGHGPIWLELDGTPLPFTRGANPYRTGAAEVDLAVLRARLATAQPTLVVHLG